MRAIFPPSSTQSPTRELTPRPTDHQCHGPAVPASESAALSSSSSAAPSHDNPAQATTTPPAAANTHHNHLLEPSRSSRSGDSNITNHQAITITPEPSATFTERSRDSTSHSGRGERLDLHITVHVFFYFARDFSHHASVL